MPGEAGTATSAKKCAGSRGLRFPTPARQTLARWGPRFAQDDKIKLILKAGGYAAAVFAFFACSARLPNPAGSLTAKSARILRSSSMPAFFSPLMNWL
jgi:hypothetical protein